MFFTVSVLCFLNLVYRMIFENTNTHRLYDPTVFYLYNNVEGVGGDDDDDDDDEYPIDANTLSGIVSDCQSETDSVCSGCELTDECKCWGNDTNPIVTDCVKVRNDSVCSGCELTDECKCWGNDTNPIVTDCVKVRSDSVCSVCEFSDCQCVKVRSNSDCSVFDNIMNSA